MSGCVEIIQVVHILYIDIETMRAMGEAALIKFALWRHLVCPHTVMHVTPTLRNLPCPHKENHLPMPMLYEPVMAAVATSLRCCSCCRVMRVEVSKLAI